MSSASSCFRTAAIAALSLATGCIGATSPSSSGSNQFDGVYDMSVAVPTQVAPSGVIVVSGFFHVTSGVISSSDNTLSGSVTDTFGDVSFSGPCPVGNTGGATFAGIIDAGNPKFGQGTWTCSNGGASSSWRVYNGH
jgi:hypothetical protein